MIRMFLGYPGGGKSFGGLRELLDEAVYGYRTLCTSVPVDLGKLSAYIQKHYPDVDWDPVKMCRILTEAECKKFWLHRGPGKDIPDITSADEEAEKWWVTPADWHHVLYVIDEAHMHFDARLWVKNSRSLTFYNSQHRKYHDEVVFITQFSDLIDKRVRGFAQEWWYFRNRGLEKFMTLFKMPKYFHCEIFFGAKCPGNVAMETRRYRLDLELAGCYDTSAGVGIVGRKAPERNRMKGVPLAWIILPFAVGAAVLMFAPEWFAKGVAKLTSSKAGAGAESAPVRRDGVPPVEAFAPYAGPNRAAGSNPEAVAGVSVDKPSRSKPVWVRSVAWKGRDAIVVLSDGRELTRSNGLVSITDSWVALADGTRFQRYRGRAPAAASAADGEPSSNLVSHGTTSPKNK